MKSIIMLLFALAGSQFACGQDSALFKKQVTRLLSRSDMTSYSMNYFKSLAKFTYNKIDNGNKWENRYLESLKNANSNANHFNADFQKIISKTREKADLEKIVFKTVEYTGRMIVSPVESLPIWGPIQKEINNQIFSAAEAELDNSYRKKLALSLTQLKNENLVKYNNIISSGNYAEVRQALQEVNFFANSAFADVGPEFKEVVEKTQEKFLRESVKVTLERVISDIEVQGSSITTLDTKITKLSQFTYKFAEESNKRFQTLETSQQALNDKLKSFYNEYQTDKKALDFMQEFLYAKMNTTEKIRALEAGLLSNISNEERKRVKDQLSLEEQKEKVINNAKNYLNTAALSIQVLNNLGLGDSKLVQDISNAVNIGQTAISSVQAFTSGNYLQFAVGITGLFGKKGSDAAASRHKQIMQRFDRIDTTLKQIERKIDLLLEGQQNLLELQLRTFNTLDSLVYVIDKNHVELSSRLTDIEQALYENRQLILQDWENECQSCLETQRRIAVDIDNDITPDPALLPGRYANLKETYFRNCEVYISRYVFSLDQPTINPVFYYTSQINNVAINRNYRKLDTINRVSFQLLFNYQKKIGNIKDNHQLLDALFFPVYQTEELLKKVASDSILLSSSYFLRTPNLYFNLVKPDIIERHGRVLRNIGLLVSLTDQNRNLISWTRLTDNTPPHNRNLQQEMTDALKLNNIAIAQQNMLSGDLLLPIVAMESYAYRIGNGDTALFNSCYFLLSKNELLATNFANFYIGEALRKNGKTVLQYSYAYNSNDSLNMSKVLLSPYPVSYLDSLKARTVSPSLQKGWYMWINAKPYSIVAPHEVDKKPLVHTQYMNGLLFNRSKLLGQLIGSNLYTGADKKNVNYLLLKE